MRKTTQEILKKFDSYIDALKYTINKWETADNLNDKKMYIRNIGEIGNLIHKENIRILGK